MHSHITPLRADRGATAAEYAILLSGVAAVIIALVATLGGGVLELLQSGADAFP